MEPPGGGAVFYTLGLKSKSRANQAQIKNNSRTSQSQVKRVKRVYEGLEVHFVQGFLWFFDMRISEDMLRK